MPQVKNTDELLAKMGELKPNVLPMLPGTNLLHGATHVFPITDVALRAAETFLNINLTATRWGEQEPTYKAIDAKLIDMAHPGTQMIFKAMEQAGTRRRFR